MEDPPVPALPQEPLLREVVRGPPHFRHAVLAHLALHRLRDLLYGVEAERPPVRLLRNQLPPDVPAAAIAGQQLLRGPRAT